MASPSSGPIPRQDALSVDEGLARVHWHLLRGDQMRAGVAARGGTVLSTDALVVAGVAVVLSLSGGKPDIVLVLLALTVLGCVAISASNAVLALVTVRSWERHFGEPDTPTAPLYCFAEYGRAGESFEDFRRMATEAPSADVLDQAVAELWRCGRLHGYRYRRLRVAMLWLLAALVFLLVAAACAGLS
ncbi:hypothetical protein EDD29_3003 [Actinocorallia herbida]|uniref:Pycsar effector protein domain-containing protein n=1 Tax=Actinocorallia herbida TaxID=58109 RepID=A0A3N1CVY2_9ACTN|nr:hypothetical protein EDD29_3003 [Actinocorallia herbida]